VPRISVSDNYQLIVSVDHPYIAISYVCKLNILPPVLMP